MNKDIIKAYIEYAIENGYKFGDEVGIITDIDIEDEIISVHFPIEYEDEGYQFTKTFMSKEFIEAIARGLSKKWGTEKPTQEQIEEVCKTQALFISGFGGEETFEDFIKAIIN